MCGTRVGADTQYSDKHAGANVADGSLASGDGCWYSRDQTQLPCALTFEFIAAEEVRQVNLVQAAWTANMYHTRDFAVEVSPDGQDWRRIAEGQLPDESLARAELKLEPVRTPWLRIVVITSYNSFQTCGLAEVEILAAGRPGFGEAQITLNGQPASPATSDVCGLSFVAADDGPQIALTAQPIGAWIALRAGEVAEIVVPVQGLSGSCELTAVAELLDGEEGRAALAMGGGEAETSPLATRPIELHAVSKSGGVALTGKPDGPYTVSYNALAPRVPYSDQGLVDPLSTPGRFGARGSALTKLLLAGHHDVTLSADELARLVTWMDANVLFYGAFDPDDQARQLRGEIIEGPKLQ